MQISDKIPEHMPKLIKYCGRLFDWGNLNCEIEKNGKILNIYNHQKKLTYSRLKYEAFGEGMGSRFDHHKKELVSKRVLLKEIDDWTGKEVFEIDMDRLLIYILANLVGEWFHDLHEIFMETQKGKTIQTTFPDPI